MKILDFGSLNIDYVYDVENFVRSGETIASKSLSLFAGGKGLNQAVALAKAGCEVFMAGMIGDDGLFLKEVLEEAGVNTGYIKQKVALKTGHAIIQRNHSGENCIIIHGGANQAITEEYCDEVLNDFESGDFLILQNEISCLDYLINKGKEKGMLIFYNPSPFSLELMAYPLGAVEVFLINEKEALALVEEELENSEILLLTLHKKYPKSKIVLTLGEKGACYYDGEQLLQQASYRCEVVDTTAAGDTFTGYFVAALSKGKSIGSALDLAAKAAAISVTRQGAAPSIPSLFEVENTDLRKGSK